MFFDGDHRTRRRKVKLGGRSKVQDRQQTLQEARRQREERQRRRKEEEASRTIGASVRGRHVAREEKRRVREEWVERNGVLGETLAECSAGGEAGLLAVRQLVFFADHTRQDALRLCSVCDMARRSFKEVWLDEARCERAGRLPSLCHLLVARSVSLLKRSDWLEGQEPGNACGSEGGGGDLVIKAIESVLPFLELYLDLDRRCGAAVDAAVARTLAFVVQSGLYQCVAKLLELAEAVPEHRGQIEQTLIKLVKRCLEEELVHSDLLDLLTVTWVFEEGSKFMATLREPLWEGLMGAAATPQGAGMVGRLLERHKGDGDVHVTLLNNFLRLSRSQRNQSRYLAPFVGLLDSLLAPSLDARPGAEPRGDAGRASEELSLIVTMLTENVEMWNGLSKSILPGTASEEMSQEKLDGTLALVSLFSKLITHCGDAQALVVMLTSLAFKVQFLEKLWFFVRSQLDLASISEGDQDDISKSIVVLCTVHVLRLQIINDKEYYQQNSLMDVSELNDVVVYIKTYISNLIESRQLSVDDMEGSHLSWYEKMLFHKAVDHLDKLHEQNGRYHLVEDASFHLKITADEAFLKDAENGGKARLICVYCPYFIPFHDRVKIFRHFLEKDRADYYSNLPPEVRMNPFLSAKTVVIRRKYILEDGYSKLDHLGQALKCIVRIQFINELGEDEAGVDGGGLFKDFLENLITTAFDTQYGFFKANPENKLYPNPSSSSVTTEHLNFFRFFGRMIGKAIYEGILVDVPFAEFFLRKIRGKKNGFDDLQTLDKELHNNLCFLRGYEGKIEDLGLYFAVEQDNFGRVVVEDLIPKGKDTLVSNASVIKYIHLMANFKLNIQMKQQSMAFMQGLQDLVNQEWISLFNDSELQELISGSEKGFDLEDMRKSMHYSGGYNEAHPVIKTFWSVVSGFTIEEQQKLLKFITACSRPPLLGFSFLEPQLCIQKGGGNEGDCSRLPTAATCMNLLKLPPYATKEEMDEKIRYAINSGSGFDLS
ncbi:HECT domain-containing ubiquitin-protein ligase [Chloropicon primus]|uniref:HECT-type E3 ubiquitin transferase n=3 Tax=Chloropicon primus TaxID=1764295 RepID=A0A5B8MFZ9_9CHLO|nr:HECT domain-containing ubiquitin-protein ligase [Chloropicon primus]UPQ98585.1 HECT domain-containing ubiquitin-protein ligase [Chloropicon primus]|eukprot:QDZ19376.1 HECT domain-containing ubiquitin-protein ligase [Chloropicon primus]